MVDHHILNHDQNEENHNADRIIAADHELAERANHFAGRRNPWLPFSRIKRVEAMFSDSRNNVDMSRIDGNEENWTGLKK